MAAPTWTEFTTAYPKFASGYDVIGPIQLAASAKLLDPSTWEEFYALGVMLECAHNLFLMGLITKAGGTGAMQLAAGPVSSVSVAGVSTSFNTPQGGTDRREWYGKTAYGQQFLRLQAVIAPLGHSSNASSW